MTEPRSPDDLSIDPATAPTEAPDPVASSLATTTSPGASPDPAENPTQAWPSLASQDTPLVAAQGATPDPATSPFEAAPSLPATRVGPVAETGTFGASATAGRRSRLRWGLALLGVAIVAVVSLLIVSLVGGRPATSTAMGYMPANTIFYEEVRLDLPGDQRQKLASFLKPFPGFADQSAIEPKLDDILDRIVRAATKNAQTWTADIKPWFGGQIAIGIGLPDSASTSFAAATGANNSVAVVTITDRAKAIAWLTSTVDNASLNRSTYGDADLLIPADNGGGFAAAINDKVMVVGTTVAVKAAIDSGGHGTLDQNDDVKAALATLDKDYVVFGVVRIRAYADAALRLLAINQPGVLDKTQLDETALALVPAWQATTGRFENDAMVVSAVGPSWTIGYDATNRPSDVLGHVPAKTLLYFDVHDAGPVLTALLGKFRALDETKPAFAQLDRALSVLGGSDAAFGWWGDTAIVVSTLADGTIGGGLVIHPRDAALADRLMTTLNGFVALGGGSAGITTRTEDHNGTKITILDLSAMPGMSNAVFPPGYKPEFAWATNANVTVMGYGSSFVAAVLDAGPGNSLVDDARFKGLLGRVGADNIGAAFVDLAAIRGLIEPLMQAQVPADKWSYYTKEIQPYLKPIDAIVSTIRKDGGLDRGTGAFTAH